MCFFFFKQKTAYDMRISVWMSDVCSSDLVPATADTGFMPDYAALDATLLDRAVFCFLNSPSNPQGAAADLDYLAALLALARKHDFVVGFDECYSEIYDRMPPAGALQAALQLGGELVRRPCREIG